MTFARHRPEPGNPDALAASMIPIAADLVCLVRDGDRDRIARRLHSLAEYDGDGEMLLDNLYALTVVLAAMVPDDARSVDLLGWLEPGSRQRDAMLAKVHGRAALRQKRGLPLWGATAVLELEYQSRRKERQEEVPRAAAA